MTVFVISKCKTIIHVKITIARKLSYAILVSLTCLAVRWYQQTSEGNAIFQNLKKKSPVFRSEASASSRCARVFAHIEHTDISLRALSGHNKRVLRHVAGTIHFSLVQDLDLIHSIHRHTSYCALS